MDIAKITNKITNKLVDVLQFVKEEDIKEELKDVDIFLNKPFSIFYAIVTAYDALKKRNYSKEDLTKLELHRLAFKSAKDTLDLLKMDYKSGGIANEVIAEKELELVDSFKNTEWNNYILSIPAIIEFKEKFSSLLKEYNYPYEQFNLLFDRLLIEKVSNNSNIELKLVETIKDLTEYLDYVASLIRKRDPINNKSLVDFYVDIKLKKDSYEWKIEELLNSPNTKWYEVIASEFGTGKSSYAYYIAGELAKDHLEGKSPYVPILVDLINSNPDNKFMNIYKQLNLDDMLKLIGEKKILIIFDNLDEYKDIKKFRETIMSNYHKDNIKVLIITRPIPSYLNELGINKFECIKIEPFCEKQVEIFLKNVGVNLTYNKLVELGLLHKDNVRKPLFLNIIANKYNILNNRKEKLNKIEISTIIYNSFVYSCIHEIHRRKENQSYKTHKEILKEITKLQNLYDENFDIIYVRIRNNNMKQYNIGDYELDKLIFTHLDVDDYIKGKKKLRFVYEYVKEYLLAEYYLCSIIKNKTYRLNVGKPTKECTCFLQGLINVLKNEYIDLLDDKFLTHKDKKSVITNAKNILKENKIVYHNESKQPTQYEDLIMLDIEYDKYKYIFIDKWIALSILNWLDPIEFNSIEKEYLVFLFKLTSKFIPYYLKNLRNIKLYLCDDNDDNDLNRIDLAGADLSGSEIMDINMEGANLSKANLSGARLINVKLPLADLSSADLTYSYLEEVDLINAYLSKTMIKGINLKDVILSDGTFTKNINLGNNKHEIMDTLNKLPESFQKIIKRDNPDLDVDDIHKPKP